MTLIQNVLQAIVAKDLHFWVMESYVASFRCGQAITNLAHRNAQVHHAFVAWRASNVPFLCRGLAAVCWLLDAMAANNYALRYSAQKLMDIQSN